MVIPEIQASILDILDMGITTHYGYSGRCNQFRDFN